MKLYISHMGESNTRIIDLLVLMGEQNASDLLITANNPPVFRIHMELVRTDFPSLTPETAKELVYQMLTPVQKSEFEREKELDFAYQIKDARFRINVHYERNNIGAAIRRISMKIPSLAELHMPQAVANFCRLPRGLILVTGPTGSGKSTTQASMIDLINNNRPCHIITVEDPIEYVHAHKKAIVEQREVGMDTNTFSAALRVILRQNPDIILVGEMRDLETIQSAITAAETGHLVISTLHTADAAQTIDRIIDVFPPHQQNQIRLQLSMVLQGVVAQQLLPRKDKRGVIPVVEVLIANSAIRNIIRKATTQDVYSVLETSGKLGMISLDSALKELYRAGLVTMEEVLGHARNIEEVEKSLKAG